MMEGKEGEGEEKEEVVEEEEEEREGAGEEEEAWGGVEEWEEEGEQQQEKQQQEKQQGRSGRYGQRCPRLRPKLLAPILMQCLARLQHGGAVPAALPVRMQGVQGRLTVLPFKRRVHPR
jgi:hypothetical protein